MALILGRQIERISQPGEKVGLLLPNLVPTIGLIFGLTARKESRFGKYLMPISV